MGRLCKKYLVIKTVVSSLVSQGILIVQVRALFELRNIPHIFSVFPVFFNLNVTKFNNLGFSKIDAKAYVRRDLHVF